jgi:hypothetical protein
MANLLLYYKKNFNQKGTGIYHEYFSKIKYCTFRRKKLMFLLFTSMFCVIRFWNLKDLILIQIYNAVSVNIGFVCNGVPAFTERQKEAPTMFLDAL